MPEKYSNKYMDNFVSKTYKWDNVFESYATEFKEG